MTDRRKRSLFRRIIRCQFLSLVVLWHFDGASAGGEDAVFWGVNKNLSTYVSSVAIAEDVFILNHEEQSAGMIGIRRNFDKFLLAYSRDAFSFFARPICRGERADVLSATENNILDCSRQLIIFNKDDIVMDTVTTCAGGYGRGEPIIFVMVTEYGGASLFAGRDGGGREAILRTDCQPKAIDNRANVGTELPMLCINRSKPLLAGKNGSEGGCSKGEGNSDRSNPIVQIAMLALGAGCSGVGFWQMSSPRRDQFGPLRVVALLLVGWSLLVAGGIWLEF